MGPLFSTIPGAHSGPMRPLPKKHVEPMAVQQLLLGNSTMIRHTCPMSVPLSRFLLCFANGFYKPVIRASSVASRAFPLHELWDSLPDDTRTLSQLKGQIHALECGESAWGHVLCRPWLRAPSSNKMLLSMGGGQRPMGLGSEFFRLLHDLHLLAFPTKCIWPATAIRGRDAASQNLERRPGSGTEARRLQGAEPSRLLRTYVGGAVIPTGTPERTQPPPPQDPLGRRRWLYRNTWGPWPGTTQPPSPQLLRNDWGSCGFMVPEAARGKVFQDSQEGAHIRRETVSKSVCAEPRSHQRARDPAPTNFPRRCQKQRGASTSSGQHEGRVNLVFFIGISGQPGGGAHPPRNCEQERLC
ncbi:putative protein FAM157B [Gorilla gorilla gorilla]|uniref:putative protein FAM157B n=1 Tax=Gorilla gorilla gorilla TaxID=9595 RepID=UPI003009E87A